MNQTKEHIITVACELFLQKSFKEVTMKEIVKQTGLSKGAFYHYFESKEQLFQEVLDFFLNNVMVYKYESYSKESFYQFYHDVVTQSDLISKEYIDKFKGDNNDSEFSMNYFNMAFDALRLFPEFRAKMLQGFENEVKIWAEVIKKARERGEIKSTMSDEEIAQTYVYLGDGVALHKIMTGSVSMDKLVPILFLWDKIYEQIKV